MERPARRFGFQRGTHHDPRDIIDRHHHELLPRRNRHQGQLALQIELQGVVQRVERGRETRSGVADDLRWPHDGHGEAPPASAHQLLGAEFALFIQAVESRIHQVIFGNRAHAHAGHIRRRNVDEALEAPAAARRIGKQQHVRRAVDIHRGESRRRFVHADFGRHMHDMRDLAGEFPVSRRIEAQSLLRDIAGDGNDALSHRIQQQGPLPP